MTENDAVHILIVLYVVEVLVAVWAYWGLLRYYHDENGRESALWSALIVMTGLVILGAITSLPVAYIALVDAPRIPGTGPLIVALFMVQLAAVIVYRVVMGRIRRRGRRIDKENE